MKCKLMGHTPSISSCPCGVLPDGTPVEAWTLCSSAGLEVEVITYGATVTRLLSPDRNGKSADIVLGFDRLDDYRGGHPYFGAVVGRVAGRIANGLLRIGNETFPLDRNDPPNHLHGGPDSIERKVWKARIIDRPDKAPSLELTCHSPDGENGYPGAVDLTVRYTVTSDNELIFETVASSSRATPVSLTQHSYFNLAGEGSDTIEDHELQILSKRIFAVDETMTLLDEWKPVEKTAASFETAKPLRDAIPGLWKQHGDLYWLGGTGELRAVASVREPRSGRIMEVATTLPCLQLYTSVSLDGTLIGKSGQPYLPFSGLCLECEGYPHATAGGEFGDILVHPDKPQTSTSVYTFSTDTTLSGQ